jgi:beta-glucosidase
VQSGKIPLARIDDAVSRIIKAKLDSGVYANPIPDSTWLDSVGSPAHRAIAREAVQQSVVLLQNKDNALPLRKTEKVCVAGRAGNDLGYQLGGWTVKWQGEDPYDTPEKEVNQFTAGTTVWGDVQKRLLNSHYDRSGICDGYDTIIAVVGEPPYAEAYGDRKDLTLHHTDKLMLKNAHALVHTESGKAKRKIILVIMSGRPLWIDDMLPHVDSVVASFLPGSEGGPGIMDVLTGAFAPTGRLGVVWPKQTATLPVTEESDANQVLYQIGHGLTFKRDNDL